MNILNNHHFYAGREKFTSSKIFKISRNPKSYISKIMFLESHTEKICDSYLINLFQSVAKKVLNAVS
jgi:hypothetical protein